jgi:hypothetical protein
MAYQNDGFVGGLVVGAAYSFGLIITGGMSTASEHSADLPTP